MFLPLKGGKDADDCPTAASGGIFAADATAT
jgi:hypothetical protein